MIMLKIEKWESVVNETIKHFFDNYKVFDDNNKALENKSLYQYINDICEKGPETEILHFLFTGESEYIQFAGKYNISLYDEFSQELENKLIDEFYSINQKQFCDDLENFTDYFLSEHTILLKTYIEALRKVYSIFPWMNKSLWNFRDSVLAFKVCISY